MADGKPAQPTDAEIKTAWGYYQQADNLQHQRHNIFILAQTILFAALAVTQTSALTKVAIALVGAVYAVMWYWLAERLSDGMAGLSTRYLEKDPVYKHYLDSLTGRISGRLILNVIIPLLTLAVWVVILMASLAKVFGT